MVFNDLIKQECIRQQQALEKDDQIAKKVLSEYASIHKFDSQIIGNGIQDLLYKYFSIEDFEDKQSLIAIMDKNKFNYIESIRQAIYYLLGRKQETESLYIDPIKWPGIDDIGYQDNVYILSTKFGQLRVSKASDVFKKTDSSYIFRKTLMQNCFQRSYDFIRKNSIDYQVVLSYEPTFFSRGFYHAYLESSDFVLDISANAYYSKEDAKKILTGEIIKKLDYKTIESKYQSLVREMPELTENNNPKLLILSLYYDCNNVKR